MALRKYLLNAVGSIASSTLFASGVVDNTALGDNAVDNRVVNDGSLGASELNLGDDYNFTGDLQKSGVDVATGTGSLYYAVVRVATTGPISNLGSGAPSSVDGVGVGGGDDILVWQQSSAITNGIYDVGTVGTGSNGTWNRAGDRDSSAELPVGMLVYVSQGTTHGQKLFKLTAAAATVGSDPMGFEEHEEGMTPVGANGEPEAVGTGDNSNLSFDLSTSGIIYSVVLVDGIEQPGSTYSISAGTGSGGVDQLVFGSGNAPGTGASVEAILFKRA